MYNLKTRTDTLMLLQSFVLGPFNFPQFLDKSFLFIGCRHKSQDIDILNKLRACGNRKPQYVLEIFPKNCQYISQFDWHTIRDNFCDIPLKDNGVEVVFNAGSIEHVLEGEASNALKEFERVAKELVLVETIKGEYFQEEIYGNPWEQHKATFCESFFMERGYEVVVGGYQHEDLRHMGCYKTLTKK